MGEPLPNLYPTISQALPDVPRFLMLGLGRQSVGLLLMAERGLIGPKPDAAIVVDMGSAERGWAREMLRTLTSPNFPLSIPVEVAKTGDLDMDFEDALLGIKPRFANPPLFTKNEDGSRGRLTRGCTRDYKINAGLAAIKKRLGYEKGARMPSHPIAEQWIGFSADERHRVSPSPVPWLHTRQPLIEVDWAVQKVERWVLEEYGLRVRHSGCYFCPNAGDAVWQAMKRDDPEEFERACQREELARDKMPNVREPVYFHDSLQPLRSIDFDALIESRRGQLLDWKGDNTLCSQGACGT